MKILLIDGENYSKIPDPDLNANIVYFHSCPEKTARKKAKGYKNVKYIQCVSSGKDSMDISLAFYLGKNLNKKNQYIIYSADTGYDSMISLAKNNGYKVSRINPHTLKPAVEVKTKAERKNFDEFLQDVLQNNQSEVKKKNVEYLKEYLDGKEKEIAVSVSQEKAIKCLSSLIGLKTGIGRKKISALLRDEGLSKTTESIANSIAKTFGIKINEDILKYCDIAYQIFN